MGDHLFVGFSLRNLCLVFKRVCLVFVGSGRTGERTEINKTKKVSGNLIYGNIWGDSHVVIERG